ncbi:MAG: type II toxin-antitoxin system VapC family toxin [Thermodesulfobacteriota bacterium]
MRVYFDTSALVAAYVPEPNTRLAVARLAAAEAVYVSWLTRVEFCSALSLKTRTGELGKEDAQRVLAVFDRHLEAKAYEVLPLSHEAYCLAASWLATLETSLKALDALHLACCRLFDLSLVTADDGLAKASRHFGVPQEHLAEEIRVAPKA